jgi:hypothetical protein
VRAFGAAVFLSTALMGTAARAACVLPVDWIPTGNLPTVVIESAKNQAIDPQASRRGRLSGLRVLEWRQGQLGCSWEGLAGALDASASGPWLLVGQHGFGEGGFVASLRFGPASTPDLTIDIKGRPARASLFTRSAPVVVRSVQDSAAAVVLVEGLASYLAFRQRGLSGADRAQFADRALRALAQWEEVAGDDGVMSALTAQVRGLLEFALACRRLDAILTLRRAVMRVPYSAEARRLLAMAELKAAYDPELDCLERRLLDSLAIDPWRADTIENLAVFYELSSHVPARGRDLPEMEEAASQGLALIPSERLPRAPAVTELAVGAGLASGLTAGLRIDLTPFGRDTSGWAMRLGLSVPDYQTRSIDPGLGQWRRYAGTAEVRGRLWLGGQRRIGSLAVAMLELHAGVALAATIVKGNNFDTNYERWLSDVGGTAGVRFGFRLRPRWLMAWGDFSGWAWPVTTRLQVTRAPGDESALPKREWTATAGISVFLWR